MWFSIHSIVHKRWLVKGYTFKLYLVHIRTQFHIKTDERAHTHTHTHTYIMKHEFISIISITPIYFSPLSFILREYISAARSAKWVTKCKIQYFLLLLTSLATFISSFNGNINKVRFNVICFAHFVKLNCWLVLCIPSLIFLNLNTSFTPILHQ